MAIYDVRVFKTISVYFYPFPLVSLSKHLPDIENLQFLIILVWKQRQDA